MHMKQRFPVAKKRCLLWTMHWRHRQAFLELAYLRRFDLATDNAAMPSRRINRRKLSIQALIWTKDALDSPSPRDEIDNQHN